MMDVILGEYETYLLMCCYRSVMKKRKELVELQENSKVMRAKLRSKKKSIKTLEQLLKDASRNRRRDDITAGERSYFKLTGK